MNDTRPRDYPPRGGQLRNLYWLGGLSAAVYLATCLHYLGGAQSLSRTARELFAWFIVLTLLPLFYKGYRAVERAAGPRAAWLVVGFAALFCLAAAPAVPFHSTDAFGYINRGWQQAHYQLNPYIYRLADAPGWQHDPMLRAHWIYNPNPYGFLFALLARGLCRLGGGNWWLTLMPFKAVNVLAYALMGWLVWSGARLLGHERPLLALYALLWTPLVLTHHLANGHNDILVGCLIALVEDAALLLFVLICVASSKLNGWYLGMILPPALLLAEGHWLRRVVLLVSSARLLSLTFFKQAYMLNYFAMVIAPCLVVYRQTRRARAGVAAEQHGAPGLSRPREA